MAPIIPHQILDLKAFSDHRGSFVKTFHRTDFSDLGIEFEVKESYFSVSAKDVIRGMHFQIPPHDHAKIVFCPHGAILDVIVDLRSKSAQYGQYYAQVLSSENHKAFYIPSGFAHGFKSLMDGTVTYYLVSSEHHPTSDQGIAFDSFGFDWDCAQPIMSLRDKSFCPLSEYKSPFVE